MTYLGTTVDREVLERARRQFDESLHRLQQQQPASEWLDEWLEGYLIPKHSPYRLVVADMLRIKAEAHPRTYQAIRQDLTETRPRAAGLMQVRMVERDWQVIEQALSWLMVLEMREKERTGTGLFLRSTHRILWRIATRQRTGLTKGFSVVRVEPDAWFRFCAFGFGTGVPWLWDGPDTPDGHHPESSAVTGTDRQNWQTLILELQQRLERRAFRHAFTVASAHGWPAVPGEAEGWG